MVAISRGGSNPGKASPVRELAAPLFAKLVEALRASSSVVFLRAPQEQAGYGPLARRRGGPNLCGRCHELRNYNPETRGRMIPREVQE